MRTSGDSTLLHRRWSTTHPSPRGWTTSAPGTRTCCRSWPQSRRAQCAVLSVRSPPGPADQLTCVVALSSRSGPDQVPVWHGAADGCSLSASQHSPGAVADAAQQRRHLASRRSKIHHLGHTHTMPQRHETTTLTRGADISPRPFVSGDRSGIGRSDDPRRSHVTFIDYNPYSYMYQSVTAPARASAESRFRSRSVTNPMSLSTHLASHRIRQALRPGTDGLRRAV